MRPICTTGSGMRRATGCTGAAIKVLPALAGGTAQTWSEYAQMVCRDDRERYLATGRGAVARGVPFDIEYRVATADGRLVWFGLRGVPMFDPAGIFFFKQKTAYEM